MCNKYVVVDLETTGNSPKKGDKIIQFAACVVEDGKIIDQYSTFVNPQATIPPFIKELTGISEAQVKTAPLFSEIAPKILKMLDGAYFVAHNVLFDLSFLQEELTNAGYEGFYGSVLDTVELARILLPTADSYKLGELANREGLSHDRPHHADSDAYATAELLIMFIDRLLTLPRATLLQLLKLSRALKSDIALLIEDLLLEKDKEVEELPNDLHIYRGIALRKIPDEFRNIEKIEQRNEKYPSSAEEKEALFMNAFPNYERRNGQFQMMDAIFSAFSDKVHALIEAGTGVGKSLAYLLPSAFFSKSKNEKIVISTYTIQLQQQLLLHDIPICKKMLPFEINSVLLKGKNNYLSLARFEQSLHEEDNNYDTLLTKMQILVWLLETENGDYDELHLSSGGMRFWEKISHDDVSLQLNSLWLQYDFYLRARNRAQHADIIITNHSLLLTDIVSNNSIMPRYHYCIIDEGHHFEKEACKHFGEAIDYFSIRMLLNQFGEPEQMRLYHQLDKLLKGKLGEQYPEIPHSFELSQLYEDLIWEMDEFFKTIIVFAKKNTGNRTFQRITSRLSQNKDSSLVKGITESGTRLSFLLKDLLDYLDKSVSILNMTESIYTEKDKKLLHDVSLFAMEIENYRQKLNDLIINPCEDCVVWIETDERSAHNSTSIYSQPVTISERLKEQFFSRKRSVIFTSATLSIKNSFRFILRELGLGSTHCRLEQIPSPFRYEEQVRLIIPNDLPEINTIPQIEYVYAISEHIISIAEATKGRILILFTSHEMLKQTHEVIKESGFMQDYVIIAQGITSGSRSRLIRNFRQFDKAILLGTSSFWEGIDIPGEDLSCLIIVRLPFSHPNEPFTEAKRELITRNGGNDFSEYSLPEAIIRFKQGFGRLIRTNYDRGLVFVFDRRIITTSYGRAFLQSIPSVPVKQMNINEAVDFIQSWL